MSRETTQSCIKLWGKTRSVAELKISGNCDKSKMSNKCRGIHKKLVCSRIKELA